MKVSNHIRNTPFKGWAREWNDWCKLNPCRPQRARCLYDHCHHVPQVKLIEKGYFLKCSLSQLHSQHKDNLERGRDGGREGGPSHQERLRDHQELRQQVLVLPISTNTKTETMSTWIFSSLVNVSLLPIATTIHQLPDNSEEARTFARWLVLQVRCLKKYFLSSNTFSRCKCLRCLDPLEMLSFTSAVACLRCKEGLVLALDPTDPGDPMSL